MPDESNLQSILQRLECVERENRRLKRLGLAAAIVVGALLFMAQAAPRRTIEAQSFVLKDASGRARADLSMAAGDIPTLSMRDGKGDPRVTLGAGDNPSLTMSNPDNSERIQLFVSPDVYGLTLSNAQVNRVGVGVWKGAPGLTLYDESQKVVWSAR